MLTKLFMAKPNGPEITSLFVDLLEVKISQTTLKKEIEEHPDQLSLLSISDVLNNYGVDNLTASFSADKLAHIPPPYITQITGRGHSFDYFTVVRNVDSKGICYFDPELHKWVTASLSEFEKLCSGVVLLAEPGPAAGERDYDEKVVRERMNKLAVVTLIGGIPLCSLVIAVNMFFNHGTAALGPFIISLLSLTGAAIAGLLLWVEADVQPGAIDKVCRPGKKINCNAVIRSGASGIKGISWSTIGFTYFAGNALLSLLNGMTSPATTFVLGSFSILVAPYIIFSIYYQWRVVKQWCILCLYVQGILLLQVLNTIAGGWFHAVPADSFTLQFILNGILCYAFPFIGTHLLMESVKEYQSVKNYKQELIQLKHNHELFETLLAKQKVIKTDNAGLGITIGPADAAFKIVKVCNPYCEPCAIAHRSLGPLLHDNPNVQLQIIFTSTNNETDQRMPPVRHLLAINEQQDEKITIKALDDWYLAKEKNYESFAAKYPMNGLLQEQFGKIAAMDEWCKNTGIEFTPTFFVNGHQLPQQYNVKDLKYLLSI